MTSEGALSPFPLAGAVVLVTGSNRGIGAVFVRELLARGAARVYAAARAPRPAGDPRVVPVRLDIEDPAQVAEAARRCGDVTVLVNNAGVFRGTPLLGAPSDEDVRAEMETNFFGTLAMMRAFAPVLGRNGGGAIVNALSVLSFINYAAWGSYSAAKSAAWSLTNSARDELAGQGTRVVAVHAGLVDTDMTSGIDLPKIAPETFVTGALDALEAGRIEALVDEHTRTYRTLLADHPHGTQA
ncbi:SDR family oxidoreductase [Streptomyces sp. NPDC047002]|uniref:SDR family oxidoreductase n=1 Tax=Streptomyces sp. NPDC047002 TaxID=3155475 RepID=UPI0034562445